MQLGAPRRVGNKRGGSPRWQGAQMMKCKGVCAFALSGLVTIFSAAADERRDYGEYLAGECTSCHRLYESFKGLRLLAGWDKQVMISVLTAYRAGEADNDTMYQIARPLDDDQIEALAVYFESLRHERR